MPFDRGALQALRRSGNRLSCRALAHSARASSSAQAGDRKATHTRAGPRIASPTAPIQYGATLGSVYSERVCSPD
ncbi:hypothetical protein AZ78_0416 [Lysobacter capsici AZ78]|uniref:Uncharacterized protein n=1 Tax=Lysobacter capsici AZ78 TaxID=1444315 RepID=A0A120AFD7_9GAMM|nr:hypothetical protein AZ78_0416 [Lysobacter capsici AZ78]